MKFLIFFHIYIFLMISSAFSHVPPGILSGTGNGKCFRPSVRRFRRKNLSTEYCVGYKASCAGKNMGVISDIQIENNFRNRGSFPQQVVLLHFTERVFPPKIKKISIHSCNITEPVDLR